MTGRTHDLAAFTLLNLVYIYSQPSHLEFSTVLVSVGANLIGGLTPDLDQPTSEIWRKIPAGSFLGRVISPILGGHRFISHSLLGLAIFGILGKYLLDLMHPVLLVNYTIVWWSFMIGVFSHLVMDSLTKEGVPWLFPLPWRIGFPPFKFLRIRTGGIIETFIVFPLLLLANIYLFYYFYNIYLSFLRSF